MDVVHWIPTNFLSMALLQSAEVRVFALTFQRYLERWNSNMMFFDLSAHLTQGGTVQYMNVHEHSQPTSNSRKRCDGPIYQ